MMVVEGRVAVITGGASGAGLGQARVFGRAGARIAIADVRDEPRRTAAAALREEGIDVWDVALDVTDRAGFAWVADAVEDHFGAPVTLLFNTAGVNGFGSVETMTASDFDWLLGVNLGGVVNGMTTFVPRMIEAGQGGHIATVASVGGFEGGRMTAPYSAAKSAVIRLMESYAQALPEYGIGVTVLCPANIRSGIAESVRLRQGTVSEDSGVMAGEGFLDALREVHDHGMEPEDLALHLKRAMEEGALYCIPYPEVREDLERGFGRILDAIPDVDELAPAAAAERVEALARFRESARAGARPAPAT